MFQATEARFSSLCTKGEIGSKTWRKKTFPNPKFVSHPWSYSPSFAFLFLPHTDRCERAENFQIYLIPKYYSSDLFIVVFWLQNKVTGKYLVNYLQWTLNISPLIFASKCSAVSHILFAKGYPKNFMPELKLETWVSLYPNQIFYL